jgi:hypothetical protein
MALSIVLTWLTLMGLPESGLLSDPPLSWHLTEEQKDKIEREWLEEVDDPRDSCAGWVRVHAFLGPRGKG